MTKRLSNLCTFADGRVAVVDLDLDTLTICSRTATSLTTPQQRRRE